MNQDLQDRVLVLKLALWLAVSMVKGAYKSAEKQSITIILPLHHLIFRSGNTVNYKVSDKS
jgi:hypothetical protein